MADMDGFREANNFGFGQTSQFDNFHVKGASNYSWGMKDRLSRIFNPKTGRAVMLAFDHGFIMGPTSGLERIDLNIVPLVQYADCIMCTRGILQTSIPANINKPVCLRSDAGSTILTELNRNAVMFSAGDGEQEAITAANLVEAVDMGNRYGIPVMGVTAVGKQMARDSRYFTRAFDTIRGASDSTTAPAAVAVHCADGGRWLPCSTGIRNCRSAVQKWLDAPASIVPANPPSISIDPTSMDSVIVEQAP